jgi:hypothetical protein
MDENIKTNFLGSLVRLASYTTACARCYLIETIHKIGE